MLLFAVNDGAFIQQAACSLCDIHSPESARFSQCAGDELHILHAAPRHSEAVPFPMPTAGALLATMPDPEADHAYVSLSIMCFHWLRAINM